MSIHTVVKSNLEQGRLAKVLGSSLQSSVIITTDDETVTSTLQKYAHELEAMFVVSSVEINANVPLESEWRYEGTFEINGAARGTVSVLPPRDHKCPRCWRYIAPAEDALCGRCEDAVSRL